MEKKSWLIKATSAKGAWLSLNVNRELLPYSVIQFLLHELHWQTCLVHFHFRREFGFHAGCACEKSRYVYLKRRFVHASYVTDRDGVFRRRRQKPCICATATGRPSITAFRHCPHAVTECHCISGARAATDVSSPYPVYRLRALNSRVQYIGVTLAVLSESLRL